MRQARTGRSDRVPGLQTTAPAHRPAGRTLFHRPAAIGAAHDFGDPQAIVVPVDSQHDAAIAVALPWPDTDLVSHRSSRGTRAAPAQQGCHLRVTLAFGGFERRTGAPLGDVEIGA